METYNGCERKEERRIIRVMAGSDWAEGKIEYPINELCI